MIVAMKKHDRSTGFTLIELMIVIVVIGILTSVALPAYQDYVRRSAIQEGLAQLSDVRIKLEQFYQNNRNYGGASCGHDGVEQRVTWGNTQNFSYACDLDADTQGYLLTATGLNNGSARGHEYDLDHGNNRATKRFRGESSTKTCWLVRGGEC